MKKVTVIGGGTGTFVVLSELKKYPLDLGVVVSMMDSGGSTGRLRDQLGVLPPGDLRQCLVALSDAPILWRKLFLYRFETGDLAGHNFGNIFISALEKITSSYEEVVKAASYILKTKGMVIPVTFEKTNMCVEYANGKIVRGEGKIDKNYKEKSKIIKAFLDPKVFANSQAIKRLLSSDYIIIGPGDVYTSIVPVLLVSGIKEAIKKSKGKIIYILNLMTKSGQTTNYKASDHLNDITFYLGRQPEIIIINNGKIPKEIINWYNSWGEQVVINDLEDFNYPTKVILADVVDRKKIEKSKGDILVDPLVRSILRHDPKKIAKILKKVIL
ncbi:MAG: uridine diphosphate-N-acetylglucosamine-binding protein YvcK [Microgenomates group bacterium]